MPPIVQVSRSCDGVGGIVTRMELLLAALTILVSLTLAAVQKRPEPQKARAFVRVQSHHTPKH